MMKDGCEKKQKLQILHNGPCEDIPDPGKVYSLIQAFLFHSPSKMKHHAKKVHQL